MCAKATGGEVWRGRTLARVRAAHGRKETAPTGGAHLSAAERRGARAGPGRGNWASGKEERKKGRAEVLGRKRNFFSNSLKQIQIKFKLKEFEFK